MSEQINKKPANNANNGGKKPGKFKAWWSRNWKTVAAGVGGFAGGVGASVGVAELGRRRAAKRYAQAQQEQQNQTTAEY